MLGAQNGVINSDVSKEVMEKYLSKCDIQIEIYEYDESSKDDLVEKFNDLFKHYEIEELVALFKLNSSSLLEIKNLISEHKLNSLFQLTQKKVEKVGQKKLQDIYNVFMKNEPKLKSETLFSQSYVSDKAAKNNDYEIKESDCKN